MQFERINTLARKREPFLFISDFKAQDIKVLPLSNLAQEDVAFSIDEDYPYTQHSHRLSYSPVNFDAYKKKFDKVIEKIKSGDTYLLNLTQATPIQTKLSLKEMYELANAHYKLRYKDEFICFSPEKFVQIKDNKIMTFPMKGTIDASIEDAKQKILTNDKEMAEHVMIVDLLRNDLSMVATNVCVDKFRYVTEIEAGDKRLLQVSSQISGTLQHNWQEKLGNILKALLPAGSISGTPKKSTLEIIEETEEYERGFFSGVFGVFDGESFESGVMIRFIQKQDGEYFYKSGGGITLESDVYLEYQELQDKIYLP